LDHRPTKTKLPDQSSRRIQSHAQLGVATLLQAGPFLRLPLALGASGLGHLVDDDLARIDGRLVELRQVRRIRIREAVDRGQAPQSWIASPRTLAVCGPSGTAQPESANAQMSETPATPYER